MASEPDRRPEGLPTLTVVAGVIQQAGHFLVCQRHRSGAFGGKWEFPGGKVEAGETAPAALQRELQEELGIAVHLGPELYRTCHAYAGQYTVHLIFYTIASFTGTPQNLTCEAIRWAPLAALAALDFLEGDAELIAALLQGHLAWPRSQP
ncbi:MAG: (deoxy)nucleoside triphosphate pyrophosphohydrolase [Candidatus Tectimicrobiota bacterium]